MTPQTARNIAAEERHLGTLVAANNYQVVQADDKEGVGVSYSQNQKDRLVTPSHNSYPNPVHLYKHCSKVQQEVQQGYNTLKSILQCQPSYRDQ